MFEVHSSPQLKVLLKVQGRSDHFGKWPVHFTCEKASRTKSGSVALLLPSVSNFPPTVERREEEHPDARRSLCPLGSWALPTRTPLHRPDFLCGSQKDGVDRAYRRRRTSLVAQTVKRLSTMRETRVPSLGWEGPLKKEMPVHSSTIARKIPWTEEPGRLQSMGSQRVGHD